MMVHYASSEPALLKSTSGQNQNGGQRIKSAKLKFEFWPKSHLSRPCFQTR